ncbi:MAG: hypothetical protein EAX86_01130 [Candidatus Heimdallarchaeota archaeon]|nr:hypothetical protein [Candidatus Heimdallarchaeota archaeon]
MSDLNHFLSQKKANSEGKSSRDVKKLPKIINRSGSAPILNQLSKEQIIELLDPLMTRIPGFASNLAWTRQKILPSNPNIAPEELAQDLGISLLEAYVILEQLQLSSE